MKKSFKIISSFFGLTASASMLIALSSCREDEHEYSTLVSLFANDIILQQPNALYYCNNCKRNVFGPNPSAKTISTPIININGDFSKVSKENEVQMKCTYSDPTDTISFEADCLVKKQGSSSSAFDKTNYNVKLFETGTSYKTKKKIKFNDYWTKENKYTLKANFIDASNLRNIVVGRIANDVIKQTQFNDELDKLALGGVVDGFPIAVYRNNYFHGLYNFNIAKGKQLFESLDGSIKPKGFIKGASRTKSTELFELMSDDMSNGWDYEYSDDDKYDWIVTSFNKFITFINNTEGQAFVDGINNYSSLNRIIDYFIFVNIFSLWDNTAKNVAWVTYDGNIWYPSYYDLDVSFGINYHHEPIGYDGIYGLWNNLFNKIATIIPTNIRTRYEYLRSNALSLDNISYRLDEFDSKITDLCKKSNLDKWPKTLGQNYSSLEYIKTWTKNRLEWLDNNFMK